MSSKITYEDKVKRDVSTIDDKYKVTAEDMNQIKSTVNSNATQLDNVEKSAKSNAVLSVTGEIIPSGSDLNDYTTLGTFSSDTTANSETLINCPHKSSGFKLIVEYLHDISRIRQKIEANDSYSTTYYRTFTINGWGEWKKVLLPNILYENNTGGNIENITLNSSISNFKEIEILYSCQNYHKSLKLPVRGSSMMISLDCVIAGNSNLILGSLVGSISGTKLTQTALHGKNINLANNTVATNDNLNFLIYKIIGY